MGIRRTIGRIGVHSRAFRVCHSLRHLATSELRILAYHRILDPAHAFDPENVSADTESFHWQMRYMKANYDVLGLSELLQLAEEPHAIPKRPAVITFDDGFADNYFNAFPILKELAIPATFSVITSMVGEEQMFWFDRAACLVRRSEPGTRLAFGAFSAEVPASTAASEALALKLLQFLKDQPDAQRRQLMDSIDSQLEPILPGKSELAPHYPLNWEQIRNMQSAGMEFGSHTNTHPILSKLPDRDTITRELTVSRQCIERNTGAPCVAIAYPEGLEYAIDERVKEVAADTGYLCGLTSLRGVNRLPMTDMYGIERIQIHHSNDPVLFEAAVQFPELVI